MAWEVGSGVGGKGYNINKYIIGSTMINNTHSKTNKGRTAKLHKNPLADGQISLA